MLKMDKKIISLVLALSILFTTFIPVISNATTESVIKDEILKKFWGEGPVSKKDVSKNIWIQIEKGVKDLSGLEYATRLECIDYEYDGTIIDFSPVNKGQIKEFHIGVVDGTKNVDMGFLEQFPNLETISIDVSEEQEKYKIDLENIEKFNNLKNLVICNAQINNANEIEKTNKLEYVNFHNSIGIKTIDFLKNNKNLKDVYLRDSDVTDISGLNGLNKLIDLDLENTNVSNIDVLKQSKSLKRINLANTQVSLKDKAQLVRVEDYIAYTAENVTAKIVPEGIFYPGEWTYTSSNENVATIPENSWYINTLKNGTATITMKLNIDNSIAKTFEIKVGNVETNPKLGSNMETTIIADNIILKANGELFKLYTSELKAERISTNVKKHVYEFVYTDDNETFHYELTMKNDGTTEYEFNGTKTILENVKDIYHTGYLTNDGIFYEINKNGTWKKVTDNVEKIINRFLLKKNGEVYTVNNQFVCNFKIIDAKYNSIVDENYVIWKVGNGTQLIKVGENFKEYVEKDEYNNTYVTTEGKIFDIFNPNTSLEYRPIVNGNGNELKIGLDGNVLLNNKIILSNVNYVYVINDYSIDERETITDYLFVRKDGTIWKYKMQGIGQLAKIEEQKDNVILKNDTLKEIPTCSLQEGRIEKLVGFDMKKLDVESVAQNFNYDIKVYKDGEEAKKVSTGSKIVLYNSKGELVKEYTAIVYGDVTGSGNPSAKDALAIIKHRTGKVLIKDALLLEAARVTENTRKTGGVPNASDALAIVKAKLGKFTFSF